VNQGSINNGIDILANGLNTAQAPTWVSQDFAAAENALMYHPDAVPGKGTIIESKMPVSQFQPILAPFEQAHTGFAPTAYSRPKSFCGRRNK